MPEQGKCFNPLNRGGDIHTVKSYTKDGFECNCFNPLNRGGDIHTLREVVYPPGMDVSILLIEAGIFILAS